MSNIKDWSEINDPWLECETFPDLIAERVNILDILDKLELEYIITNNGEFSHKLRCPFPNHSEGSERTASMFVSTQKNSFYCFGCNTGKNVIDFTMKMLGMPYQEALKWLAELAGITDVNQLSSDPFAKKERRDPEKNTGFQALKIANLVREHLVSKKTSLEYNKWVAWADKRFKKLDTLLDSTEDKDWEVINNYYLKLKGIISKK